MARRRKTPVPPRAPAAPRPEPFHAPFARLRTAARRGTAPGSGTRTRSDPVAAQAAASRAPEPADGPLDDRQLFEQAMAGVVPLPPAARARVEEPQPSAGRARPPLGDEAEGLAQLADLVSGATDFDITDTDEYVEGRVAGLDPRLLRRLRAGEFAYQAHLDLHRMTSDEARVAVERFLREAVAKGRRCVLIIHGRGLNSKDQIPILKGRLTTWLTRGSPGRVVLAFATARPCDGGAGAVYVLVRRNRHGRAPFVVTQGAKR
jgi:DNA-nicking Smr family endonuclease